MKRRLRRGFTLLEVMVSIAILAICLTAVFSTEAGSVRMATRARKMGFATLLARCKMGELEEEIAVKGPPPLLTTGSDECCADAEIEGFSCAWEIEPIVMPDTMFSDTGEAAELLQGAAATTATSAKPTGNEMPAGATDLLGGGGDVDGMAAIAMQYVYPVLKPSFESQIRRATITVSWREGSAERSFDVTQYIVIEPGAALEPEAKDTPEASPNSGAQP
jgi:general secretion pathway protein I